MQKKIWKNEKKVWEYVSMGMWKCFLQKIVFVNSSLKPFIHLCFTESLK